MSAAPFPIVLATANARYAHTALGLRYLRANLGTLRDASVIAEFTISERPLDMVERILAHAPVLVGLSVFIWNEPLLREVAQMIKQVRPAVRLVVGGPEVIEPRDLPPIADLADAVVCGEGEAVFADLAQQVLRDPQCDLPRMTVAAPLDLSAVNLPTGEYSDGDIAHRTIYVETSRGCPFGCEFCLSSRDKKVRRFPLPAVLRALETLYRRGVRQFKFVDRTFNVGHPEAIFDWLAQPQDPDLFAHFEVVPDRIDAALLAQLARFAPGAIQLEAGIQTLDPAVAARIGRRQDADRALQNLTRLRRETGVHIHADLVAGLPGEDVAQFSRGFDRLLHSGAHEIQVGILKRLRGAPIDRHTQSFGMVYRQTPPYDILCNDAIPFADMQRLKRFARYFDLVYNSGNFARTARLVLSGDSPFARFMAFADWLFAQVGQTGNIALDRLAALLFSWLTEEMGCDEGAVADDLLGDYTALGRRRYPPCVREHATLPLPPYTGRPARDNRLPARQQRHLDGDASAADTDLDAAPDAD